MFAPVDSDKRLVVPRWRTFADTIQMGELWYSRSTPIALPESASLSAHLAAWRENRTLPFAADLVAAALVLGCEDEAADAAEFIARSRDGRTASLDSVLERVKPKSSFSISLGFGPATLSIGERIARLKKSLVDEPHNPFAWVDLARLYATVGLREKAKRAISVAIHGAPDNRFVLRSAARLFLLDQDPERAFDVLQKSHVAGRDPWVAAAEIATSGLAGRRAKTLKLPLAMLDSSKFSRHDVSELASAIATVELGAGNDRFARRHFRTSLEAPTENAVAQAAWASKRLELSAESRAAIDHAPRSYEASFRVLFTAGRWEDALAQVREWSFDEPFATEPAVWGSFVAGTQLEEHQVGVELTEGAALANPHDFFVLNNRAFALANVDRVAEAEAVFAKIPTSNLTDIEKVVWTATKGLVDFRRGRAVEGRDLYRQAIDLAVAHNLKRQELLGRSFLALEECRLQTEASVAARNEVLDRKQQFKGTYLEPLLARVERARPRLS